MYEGENSVIEEESGSMRDLTDGHSRSGSASIDHRDLHSNSKRLCGILYGPLMREGEGGGSVRAYRCSGQNEDGRLQVSR